MKQIKEKGPEEKPEACPTVGKKRDASDHLSTPDRPTKRVLVGRSESRDGPWVPVYQDELNKRKQETVDFNNTKFGANGGAAAYPLPKLLHESGIQFFGPWLEDPRTDFISNPYRKCPAYAIDTPLGVHRKLADAIESGIYAWVDDYCVDSADVLESFSSQEKEHLIKGLNNYCLQDNWSSLLSQLGPHSFAYENLPKILAGAILAKSIWGDVVKDPFFFLGENCAPVSSDIHPDLFLPSRSQIHNMWRWCEEVNSYDACKWRRSTLHHLIGDPASLSCNSALKKYTTDLRDQALEHMVQQMIKSGPLRRFMKDIDDADLQQHRIGNMRALYFDADQLSCGLHTQEDMYQYHSFDSLSLYSPGTSWAEMMVPSWVHSGESDEKRELKDRQVLFQFRPAFSLSSGERHERNKTGNTQLLWPATVVLSDETLATLAI